MKYSAKILLLAFRVQRNNILNFCAGVRIGKSGQIPATVAKRYRPVARILSLMVDRLQRQLEVSNVLPSKAMQSIKGISLQCRFSRQFFFGALLAHG